VRAALDPDRSQVLDEAGEPGGRGLVTPPSNQTRWRSRARRCRHRSAWPGARRGRRARRRRSRPRSRGSSRTGVHADGLLLDAQQLLDRSLGLLVGALADVAEADSSVAVDEVEDRPVPVVERPPHGEVVVDGDRVADAGRAREDPGHSPGLRGQRRQRRAAPRAGSAPPPRRGRPSRWPPSPGSRPPRTARPRSRRSGSYHARTAEAAHLDESHEEPAHRLRREEVGPSLGRAEAGEVDGEQPEPPGELFPNRGEGVAALGPRAGEDDRASAGPSVSARRTRTPSTVRAAMRMDAGPDADIACCQSRGQGATTAPAAAREYRGPLWLTPGRVPFGHGCRARADSRRRRRGSRRDCSGSPRADAGQ
jgi:hypothetical protein